MRQILHRIQLNTLFFLANSCGMTKNQHGNPEPLAKAVYHTGGISRTANPVMDIHGCGLIDQYRPPPRPGCPNIPAPKNPAIPAVNLAPTDFFPLYHPFLKSFLFLQMRGNQPYHFFCSCIHLLFHYFISCNLFQCWLWSYDPQPIPVMDFSQIHLICVLF